MAITLLDWIWMCGMPLGALFAYGWVIDGPMRGEPSVMAFTVTTVAWPLVVPATLLYVALIWWLCRRHTRAS